MKSDKENIRKQVSKLTRMAAPARNDHRILHAPLAGPPPSLHRARLLYGDPPFMVPGHAARPSVAGENRGNNREGLYIRIRLGAHHVGIPRLGLGPGEGGGRPQYEGVLLARVKGEVWEGLAVTRLAGRSSI